MNNTNSIRQVGIFFKILKMQRSCILSFLHCLCMQGRNYEIFLVGPIMWWRGVFFFFGCCEGGGVWPYKCIKLSQGGLLKFWACPHLVPPLPACAHWSGRMTFWVCFCISTPPTRKKKVSRKNNRDILYKGLSLYAFQIRGSFTFHLWQLFSKLLEHGCQVVMCYSIFLKNFAASFAQ